jgi:hypothetical protein
MLARRYKRRFVMRDLSRDGYVDRAEIQREIATAKANAKVPLYVTPAQLRRLIIALVYDRPGDEGDDHELYSYLIHTWERDRG